MARQFTGIQLSRFTAAMLAVATHITQAISIHITDQGPKHLGEPGNAGVDVFFVVSGFVMAVSIHAMRGNCTAARASASLMWCCTARRLPFGRELSGALYLFAIAWSAEADTLGSWGPGAAAMVMDTVAIGLVLAVAVVLAGCASWLWLEKPMTMHPKRLFFKPHPRNHRQVENLHAN